MPRRSGTTVKVSDASAAQLERYRGEIQRELERARTEDKAEVAELQRRLDEATEWISDRKKADSDRDAAKDDQTTIVVPPSTVAPQPSHETRSTNDPPSGQESRRGGWKRFY